MKKITIYIDNGGIEFEGFQDAIFFLINKCISLGGKVDSNTLSAVKEPPEPGEDAWEIFSNLCGFRDSCGYCSGSQLRFECYEENCPLFRLRRLILKEVEK